MTLPPIDDSRAAPELARDVTDQEAPIVVVGAHLQSLLLLVDAIPSAGETTLGHGYSEPMDGGKATNQAVAAARLGAPVRLVSLVGDDERGGRMLAYLREFGVDTRWLGVADAPTDVGFVMLPPDGIPAITSSQDLSARLDERAVESVAAAFDGASVVVCQLEAPIGCALAAFAAARRVGARTILNPAPATPMPTRLLELCDILVPNEHEALLLLGRATERSALAAALAAQHPGIDVVVTAGRDGAFVATRDGHTTHVRAPEVAAVDTTGAGDAFVGALAARTRLGDDLIRATEYAVAAAAISVTRPGTLSAYPIAAEVVAQRERAATHLNPT
jgi:ribokinase